jgi:hypothetical protein
MKLGSVDARGIRRTQIHSMDHTGTPGGVIAADFGGQRHVMKIDVVWENCGVVFESVECSCGMTQHVRHGSGCWQYGHNEPMPDRLTLDAGHDALYQMAQECPLLAD